MKRSNTAVLLLSAAGAALSLYALHAVRSSEDVNYKPFCDISQNLFCSKALKRPQAFPLSYYGLVKPGSPYDVHNAAVSLLFFVGMSTFPYGRRTMRLAYLSVSGLAALRCLSQLYGTYKELQVVCPVYLTIGLIELALFATVLAAKQPKERGRKRTATDPKRKRG